MTLNNVATLDVNMDLNMDVNMLPSLVNMQLRDRDAALADLCKAQDRDQATLVARLAGGDFHYQPDQKQFR